jgi:hypothetical protein
MKRPDRWIDRIRAIFDTLDCNRAGDVTRRLGILESTDTLDLALVVEATNVLINALDLNQTHILDDARDPAGKLADSIDRACAATGDEFASAREQAAAHASALTSALTRAAAHARTLANARDHARGHAVDLAQDIAWDLARYCRMAGNLAVYLTFHSVRSDVRERVARCEKSMPWRVIKLAVRILPVSERLRYREEFRGEFLDPEFLNQPSYKQLGSALWLLACMPVMRRTLNKPKHRAER